MSHQILCFDVPTVPSMNNVYRNISKYRRILMPEGKRWKLLVQTNAKIIANMNEWKLSANEKLVMELVFYWPDKRRRDCDNQLKLLCDTLQGVLYEDDRWILPRVIDFKIDKKNPRVSIRLYRMNYDPKQDPMNDCVLVDL